MMVLLRRYAALTGALLLSAVSVWLIPSTGTAFTLKTLVMPGKVIRAHADVEEHCERCHETTATKKQSDLCFTCHTAVRDDVAGARGFHGHNPDTTKTACYSCHDEHAGRDAAVAPIDAKTFSHDRTDFPLVGAHRAAACSACHSPSTPHRETATQCGSCHAKDDRHAGSLGQTCSNCHSAAAWREVKFDHKKTYFSLDGAHANAPCASCHKNAQFAGTPGDCAGCHKTQDVHKGRNGTQCASCHTATAWRVKFDHGTKTGFALQGKHQSLTCERCHVRDLATKLPTTCAGCHGAKDPHAGKLGATCSQCHAPTSWRTTSFDHAAATSFPLVGSHAAVQCTSCHTKGMAVKLARDCASCHAGDDPHKGQLVQRCETCHAQTAWTKSIRFDHDLAKFPLLGAHAALACTECHATRAFHDAGSACADCHKQQDAHAGRFGAQCGTCHHPTAWPAARFDHDKTKFSLTGAHANVGCASCHKTYKSTAATTGVTAAAPRECGACHRQRDPHGGRFGAACGDCHTTRSFADVRRR